MRLTANIEVYGGGPGSGCHGPNCGRPGGKGTQPGSSTAPARRATVKQQYRTQSGTTITILGPKHEREQSKAEKAGPNSFLYREHALKGQFQQLGEEIAGPEGNRSRVFSAQLGDPDEEGSRGVTVWLHRYPGQKRAVVQEIGTAKYNERMFRTYHEAKYRNVGSAMGFLNRRYGISIATKGMR